MRMRGKEKFSLGCAWMCSFHNRVVWRKCNMQGRWYSHLTTSEGSSLGTFSRMIISHLDWYSSQDTRESWVLRQFGHRLILPRSRMCKFDLSNGMVGRWEVVADFCKPLFFSAVDFFFAFLAAVEVISDSAIVVESPAIVLLTLEESWMISVLVRLVVLGFNCEITQELKQSYGVDKQRKEVRDVESSKSRGLCVSCTTSPEVVSTLVEGMSSLGGKDYSKEWERHE